MEIIHLATGHAFDLLGSVAIIASLLFTAVELQHVGKAQRVSNLLTITRHHREIWSELYRQPALKRVLNSKADLTKNPVTTEEELFVTFLILHLNSVFKANHAKMFEPATTLRRDIAGLFALPIPMAVWQKSRVLQDADFIAFVESAREPVQR